LNPAAEQQYGVSASDAVGRHIDEIYRFTWISPQDEATAREQLGRTGFWHGENIHLKRSGEAIQVESTVSVLKDRAGDAVGLLAIIRDITQRKEAEAALRKSEARLRSLFEANLVGLLYAHIDGRFVNANDKFLELVGYSREELEAGLLDALKLTPPEHQEIAWAAQRTLLERGTSPLYEKEYLRKDGSRVQVLIGTAMLEDDNLVVAFVLDLTQLKQTEAKLSAALSRERNIAVALQHALTQMPAQDAFPGFQVHAVYEPASTEADVGGDFMDAFMLDDAHVAVVVGDISGKGLQAAARTAEIKYTLRGMLYERRAPAAALTGLNEYLCDAQHRLAESAEEFVCASVAVVECLTGKVRVSVAGAEPPLFVRQDGSTKESQVRGTPLGVFREMEYQEEVTILEPDELLLLTTDGITEARRGAEFFGYAGFKQAAISGRNRQQISALAERLVGEARTFAGGALHDDACLLLIRRNGHLTPIVPDLPSTATLG
jgi:PAS domain S-box-containing protein